MKNYLKFPLPTTASWFRLPERVLELENKPDPTPPTPFELPYKVYTALLTQSGGNNPQTFSWEDYGPILDPPILLKGVSYYIDSNDSNTDFTIAGAPNNNSGTHFTANGKQPNWQPLFENSGNYIQLEYNEGAPVVTVLENTIGNVWFTYNDVGAYFINSNNLFTNGKTYLYNQAFLYGPDEDRRIGMSSDDPTLVQIITTNTVTPEDDNLYNTSIEIRVYN